MTATKDRLAAELRKIGLNDMAAEAEQGRYDDWLSQSATPILDLVVALKRVGTKEALDLAMRAMDGKFDGTKEESDAWAQSEEGRRVLAEFGGGKQ